MPEDNEARYLCEINVGAIKESAANAYSGLSRYKTELLVCCVVYLMFFSGSKRASARMGGLVQSETWTEVRRNFDRIMEAQEISQNPCSKLLIAACKFPEPSKPPEPDGRVQYKLPSLNQFTRMNQDNRLIRDVEAFRTKVGTQALRDSEYQMIRFYESCLNRNSSGRESRQRFIEELRKIGLLQTSGPVLPVLAKLALLYGIHNPLLDFHIRYSSTYGGYYIHIFPYNTRTLATVEPTPPEDMRFNETSETIEKLDAALEDIFGAFNVVGFKNVSVEEMFAEDGIIEVGSHTYDQFVLLNKYVTSKLTEISNIMRQGPVSESATFHLLHLTKNYTEWHGLMNDSIHHYLNRGQRDLVVVDCPHETFHLLRSVENSEELREVFRMYGVAVFTQAMHRISAESRVHDHLATDHSFIEISVVEDFCFHQARRFFPHTFGAMLGRELESPIAQDDVRMIMRMLLLAIKLVVDDSSIQGIPGFEDLGSEIAATSLFVGYPKHLDLLGTTEHGSDIRSDYYMNVLAILKSQNEKKLSVMGRTRGIHEDRWPVVSVDDSTLYYGSDERVLVIPSEWMMYPYYAEETMYLTTLGALGYAVSQRIFHSIYTRLGIANQLDSTASLYSCLLNKFTAMERYFTRHKLLEYAFVKNFAFQAVIRAAEILQEESFDWSVEGSDEAEWKKLVIMSMAFPSCDIPKNAGNPVLEERRYLTTTDFSIFMDQDSTDLERFDPWNCSTSLSGSRCIG